MLRFFAVLVGIVFIFAGVAGYMPAFMQDGLLFGYFEVDSMHNIVHMVTGVIAIMAATSYRFTKLFFAVFGLVYTIVGIIGFWRSGDLFIMHTNMATNIFHVVFGVISLYLGFSGRRYSERT